MNRLNNIKYSVVVPVYNEDGNVEILHKEIKSVMDSLGNYEIIYINDGSKDDTFNHLKKLKKVKIIDLNRNYGQSTAMDAGFKEAVGEIIISMDGDLQNDPKDIPKLLDKLENEDLDVVVCGWRKNRKDKGGIRVLTKIGRFCRKVMIKDDVHDTGCTLRVYKREAAKSLDLQGEMHRYILAMLRWKGFKIGEVVVNHRPRVNGKTKYGYSKAERGFIDLIYVWFISKYSQRPLHMFGRLTVISFLIGFISLILTIIARIGGLSLNRNGWFFLTIFFFLAGIMFFSFGIIIDLLIKIYHNTSPQEKRYYVRDIIKN
jgi:glycosyltransferase involved in cell wall biosynthesis